MYNSWDCVRCWISRDYTRIIAIVYFPFLVYNVRYKCNNGEGTEMARRKKVILNTYIDNIVSSMGKKNCNYAFVKHYGRYCIDAEEAQKVMAEYGDLEVSYVHFANNEMVESYEPFLSIIKDCYKKYYSELAIEEYLAKFEIYELHKSFFKSYIDRDECERYEPFILDEIKLEKMMMLEAVTNIILTLSKEHPMFIMIDNAHMISGATLRVLKLLFEHPDNQNIGVYAAYNDLKHVTSLTKNEWAGFIKAINVKGCVFEGGAYGSEANADENSGFVFDSQKADEYLYKIKSMYCTVELECAEYYLQKIYKKLSNEKINIDADCKYELLRLYAEVLINLGDFATALIICDALKKMCGLYSKLEYKYYYYLLFTYIEMYCRKNESAKEMVSKCKKIAEKMDGDIYLFRAEMLEYMIDMLGWHNIFFIDRDIDVTDEFIEKIKEYKYYNHLASMYIYAFDNDFEPYKNAATVEEVEQGMVRYREGITLAKKLGNTSLILKAYQKLTMMSSVVGSFHFTEAYYEKYVEFLGNNDDVELANAKNGQGYVNCTARNFKKANECYNRALGILMQLGDIRAVGETLYNMSVNCILAQDYSSALNYLKTCVRIVEKMRLNDLRVCNMAKLYGLLALASARLSYEFDSSFYLNANKKFLAYIINKRTYKADDNKKKVFTGNDDELFLHYFVRGLLEENHGKNEEALQSYKTAETHCMVSLGNKFFSYVQLYVAMAGVYKKLGDKTNELAMIDKAYAYAQERNYKDQVSLLENMRQGADYNQEMVECTLENHTIEQIDELIEKASVVMKNNDMSNQLEFVSVWQNVIEINDKTKEELIGTAANSFMLNFNLDSFLYIEFHEKTATILFNNSSVELNENELEMLRTYFEKRKSGFVTTKIDKDFEDYKKILDLFGIDLVLSMVCSPYFENEKLDSLFISCINIKTDWNVENHRYFLNEDEAGIFNLLLRQLLIAIDKIENLNEIRHMNEALKQSSFTDYLTGLRNRNGLYDSFNKLLGEANCSGVPLDLAVLYIDLDNFKYYNDTFGHDVGDLVLKEVANILNVTAQENGFAIRYGGDEFLIILVNADKEEAMKKAQLILDTLLSKNGYVDRISEFLGKQVVIKEGKKLSCSIGVAMKKNIGLEKELSELLMHADASLYDVKNTTKNAIKYYE